MRVEQLADPQVFLTCTERLRAAEPVLTNIIGSVAQGVLAGRQYERCWWWVVRDDDGEVVGCALRTAPFLLAVSPMPAEAAAALGTAVAAGDPDLPGSVGRTDVVAAVLDAAAPGVPQSVRMAELIRVLGTFRPATGVPGSSRPARPEDLDHAVDWMEEFFAEAGVLAHDVRRSTQSLLAEARLWYWEVDGRPVSMAGHAPLVATPAGDVARIGPVFTPVDQRRRGYGAAVTTAVTAALLPRCGTVMLNTDAANPTSNGVYARLGFDVVAEIAEVVLTPDPTP